MAYYALKLVVTSLLIVLISEVSRRSSLVGAILASVPLVSVLAMTWLYIDTKDVAKVSALSGSIFWLVLPSLSLFVSLPVLLKLQLDFYLAMGIAIAITVACYLLMLGLLTYFGIKL